MGRLVFFFSLLALALPVAAQNLPSKPPLAAVHAAATSYFGVTVSDPYHYMENAGNPAAAAWIAEQSAYARSMLHDIPGRSRLLGELKEIAAAEPARLGRMVVLPGNRYLYLKQVRGTDYYDLYERDGLDGKQRLLVDPRSTDFGGKAHSAISFFSPSFDGRYVAYGISSSVTGDTSLYVLNVETDEPLPNVVTGVAFPVAAWLPDGQGLLYWRSTKPPSGAPLGTESAAGRIYLHRLGTKASQDVEVFAPMTALLHAPEGEVRSIETAPGSNYVVAAMQQGPLGSLVLYAAPLAQAAKGGFHWTRIGNNKVTILDYRLRGNNLFLLVNGLQGPVVANVPLQKPKIDNWGMMLQLSPAQTVTGMQAAKGAVYLTVIEAGVTSLMRLPYNSSQEILRATLPFPGRVSLYDEDPRSSGVLAKLSSWTRAPAVYRYDLGNNALVKTDLWPSGPDSSPNNLVAVNVSALGSNGALVPMTILYEKGLQLDGTHPTLLVAYGYHSSPSFPTFRPSWLVWLNRGGVIAFAHVSGEGQFGALRRVDGLGVNWSGRYQDFLTCAHYLIDQGYTTQARLAAIGGTGGSVLVGRAITSEPELFRAVVIASGWLDPLEFSDGANAQGFGSTSTLEGFRKLESVSSYEHVKPGTRYPAVLLEAAWNDAPSLAWQSAKMAARLEADTKSGLPILLDVQPGRNNNWRFGAADRRAMFVNEISFLLWQLGEPGFQPSVPTTMAAQ